MHDVRFVEDNWESPTLGAWGLGWEVWLNGMEITQFTYFQQVGGLDCRPVTGEITYGLERLAMYLQGVEASTTSSGPRGPRARHLRRRVPSERGRAVGVQLRARRRAALLRHFDDHERACQALLAAKLPLPAYEQVLKASHTFNLLDARRAISVTERQRYILRVRALAQRAWPRPIYESRQALGFPLLKNARGGGGAASHRARAERSPQGRARPERRATAAQRDLLVELGTEELPPKALRTLEQALVAGIGAGLDKAGLLHGELRLHHAAATGGAREAPRRRPPVQTVKRRGPPLAAAFDAAGEPTRAARAFAESCGVDVGALERLDEGKGEFSTSPAPRPARAQWTSCRGSAGRARCAAHPAAHALG